MYKYSSIKHITESMKLFSKKPTKSLGQNFLIDENIVNKIIDSSDIDNETAVIEIGPGMGALSAKILDIAKSLHSVEIDKNLYPYLEYEFKNFDNFTLVKEDALKYDFASLCDKLRKFAKKIVVIANLPYNISTPIMMKFIEDRLDIDKYVFMMQKELAKRISSKENSKDYGSLTVFLNYRARANILFDVKPNSFIPVPNVDSNVVEIIPRESFKLDEAEEKMFFKLVKSAFAQRRKKLVNSVNSVLGIEKEILRDALIDIGFTENTRAENIKAEEYATLTKKLIERMKNGS